MTYLFIPQCSTAFHSGFSNKPSLVSNIHLGVWHPLWKRSYFWTLLENSQRPCFSSFVHCLILSAINDAASSLLSILSNHKTGFWGGEMQSNEKWQNGRGDPQQADRALDIYLTLHCKDCATRRTLLLTYLVKIIAKTVQHDAPKKLQHNP